MNFKILVLVVLLIFGAVAYKFYTDKTAVEEAIFFDTEPVIRMSVKKTVSATGTVQPRDSVEVSSKITARIKEIYVKENDFVEAGQVVALLDAKDFEAKRNQANFKMTNALQKLNRIEQLYKIGAKSKEELEDAQYAYDNAKSMLEESESDVAETVIKAPLTGVVVGEPKTAGSMATQGSDNPTVIMRIADLSEKQIKAKVDETDIGSVKVGQEATFTVDAHNDKEFKAKVEKISQTDTANSWDSNKSSTSSSSSSVIYYYVTLTAIDTENLLLPAMTARLEIIVGRVENALCVPIAALKTDNKGSYVEKITKSSNPKESDKAEKIYVKVGLYGDEYVEVQTNELKEKDLVSVSYELEQKKEAKKEQQKQRQGGRPPI